MGKSNNRDPKEHGKFWVKSPSKEKFKCYKCDKDGPIKRNCKLFKKEKNDEKMKKKT